MKLIHVNPVSGVTGTCRATTGTCPFGSSNHFDTAKEARQAYELRQIVTNPIQKTLTQIPIEQIVDPELLQKMITDGYIMQSAHPDNSDLKILCYGTKTQIQGKWNDATKIARGLIVQTDGADISKAVILQRPWTKFFTLSQMGSSWHLGDEENESSAEDAFTSLDFKASAEVYDKMDGSLGILYRDPNGAPTLSTKGSFISEQAQMFTKLLRSDSSMSEAAEGILEQGDTTAMFELVGPGNRIVLSYSKNDIILLGGVNKASGVNVAPETIKAWHSKKLPVVERMAANSLEEALSLSPRDNREGVVVSVGGKSPMKIKIKQDDYKRLHRIVTMFSPRESRNIVMEMESSYADLLLVAKTEDVTHFEPIKAVMDIDGFTRGEDTYEYIRSKRETYFKEIIMPQAAMVAKAQEVIDSLDESWFTDDHPIKNFALNVKTLDADQVSLFSLFRAKINGIPLEELNASQELRRAIKNVKTNED